MKKRTIYSPFSFNDIVHVPDDINVNGVAIVSFDGRKTEPIVEIVVTEGDSFQYGLKVRGTASVWQPSIVHLPGDRVRKYLLEQGKTVVVEGILRKTEKDDFGKCIYHLAVDWIRVVDPKPKSKKRKQRIVMYEQQGVITEVSFFSRDHDSRRTSKSPTNRIEAETEATNRSNDSEIVIRPSNNSIVGGNAGSDSGSIQASEDNDAARAIANVDDLASAESEYPSDEESEVQVLYSFVGRFKSPDKSREDIALGSTASSPSTGKKSSSIELIKPKIEPKTPPSHFTDSSTEAASNSVVLVGTSRNKKNEEPGSKSSPLKTRRHLPLLAAYPDAIGPTQALASTLQSPLTPVAPNERLVIAYSKEDKCNVFSIRGVSLDNEGENTMLQICNSASAEAKIADTGSAAASIGTNPRPPSARTFRAVGLLPSDTSAITFSKSTPGAVSFDAAAPLPMARKILRAQRVNEAQPAAAPPPMDRNILRAQPAAAPPPMDRSILRAQPAAAPLPMDRNILRAQPAAAPLPMDRNILRAQRVNEAQPAAAPQPMDRNILRAQRVNEAQPAGAPQPMDRNILRAQPAAAPPPMDRNILRAQPAAAPLPMDHNILRSKEGQADFPTGAMASPAREQQIIFRPDNTGKQTASSTGLSDTASNHSRNKKEEEKCRKNPGRMPAPPMYGLSAQALLAANGRSKKQQVNESGDATSVVAERDLADEIEEVKDKLERVVAKSFQAERMGDYEKYHDLRIDVIPDLEAQLSRLEKEAECRSHKNIFDDDDGIAPAPEGTKLSFGSGQSVASNGVSFAAKTTLAAAPVFAKPAPVNNFVSAKPPPPSAPSAIALSSATSGGLRSTSSREPASSAPITRATPGRDQRTTRFTCPYKIGSKFMVPNDFEMDGVKVRFNGTSALVINIFRREHGDFHYALKVCGTVESRETVPLPFRKEFTHEAPIVRLKGSVKVEGERKIALDYVVVRNADLAVDEEGEFEFVSRFAIGDKVETVVNGELREGNVKQIFITAGAFSYYVKFDEHTSEWLSEDEMMECFERKKARAPTPAAPPMPITTMPSNAKVTSEQIDGSRAATSFGSAPAPAATSTDTLASTSQTTLPSASKEQTARSTTASLSKRKIVREQRKKEGQGPVPARGKRVNEDHSSEGNGKSTKRRKVVRQEGVEEPATAAAAPPADSSATSGLATAPANKRKNTAQEEEPTKKRKTAQAPAAAAPSMAPAAAIQDLQKEDLQNELEEEHKLIKQANNLVELLKLKCEWLEENPRKPEYHSWPPILSYFEDRERVNHFLSLMD